MNRHRQFTFLHVFFCVWFDTRIVVSFSFTLSTDGLKEFLTTNHLHSRRSFGNAVISIFSAAVALSPRSVAAASKKMDASVIALPSTSVVVPNECQIGHLAMEEAVPGAYEHPCMPLETRVVPIHVPKGSNNNSSTVMLNIHQGIYQSTPVAGSTGMTVWNSAIILTRVLEIITALQTDQWKHKTVVELGCGTGMASLAHAVLGAEKVIASDGNPNVVELAMKNVQENHLENKVFVRQLHWGWMEALDCAALADVIIGADLTYSPSSWPTLADTMATLLKDNGIVIYVSLGHSGFNVQAEVDGYLSIAKDRGLVCVNPGDDGWPFPNIVMPLDFLLQDQLTYNDRNVLKSTGGMRINILTRKKNIQRQTV